MSARALARLEERAEVHDEPAPQLIPVDLSGLADASYFPPDYVLQTLIPRGYVTLLAGHGGMGKSMLALTISAHVVAAREWARLYPSKLRCVFVSLEDPGELVRLRLRNICRAYGLPYDAVEGGLTIFDGTSAGPLFTDYGQGAGAGPTSAWEELRSHCKEAGFIVIDNASDAFDGFENDRRQVRAFMRMLANLAREEDAGVLLLAHIDKNAAKYGGVGNNYSGSTAWHNSARSRLALVEEGGSPSLSQEKLNLGRKLETPVSLRFNDHGVLLPVTAASIAEAESSDAELVFTALREVVAAGGTVPTATSGPCQAIHALEVALPADLAGKAGRRRVNAALLKLQQVGRITRTEYRNSRRHVAQRWELAHTEGQW